MRAKPADVDIGFASFKDRSFELIVIDIKTGREVMLSGTLRPDQTLEEVDRVLPTCVFVRGSILANNHVSEV